MTTERNIKEPDKPFQYKAPLLILFLFLISLLLRFHAIDDSIRGGHVWLTAHTVLTLQIWFDEGIDAHHYSPVYTYNNKADRHMRSLASGIPDKEGRYYYVSYAPFSFLFAFFILKIAGVYPSMLSVQVINLGLHLITSWLIYIVICRFYRKRVRGDIWAPALVGSIIYLFSMHPLWCHAYVYFADTLVLMLGVIGLIFALEFFLYKKEDRWSYLLGFGGVVFLMIYTEWLGLFFAATVFFIAALHAVSDKSFIRLMLVVAIATCLAMAAFILQYGSINDLSTFVEASFNKYFERSGYDDHGLYFTQLNIQFVMKHYMKLYYPIMGMILFLLLASLVNKRIRTTTARRKEFMILLSLLALPILAHHTVFLGFTVVHDFALLKSSILAAILIGVLFNRSSFYHTPEQNRFSMLFSGGIIGIMLILSLVSYYDFVNLGDDSKFEEVGNVIKKTASNDEALYLVSHADIGNGIMIFMAEHRSISPQVQMIARRNLLGVKNKPEAIAHMKQFGNKKGRIYTLNNKGHVINIESILLSR